jgi:hypothetical protein
MLSGRHCSALLLAALSLGGCAVVPTPVGPTVMVLPTPGKPLDLFQAEDYSCRQWASQQIGMSPQDIANQNAANSAAAGAIVGAAIGGLIGSASGDAAEGMALGAGSGLLIGASEGAASAAGTAWDAQRRYDVAYQQCMHANGNILPGMTYRVWRTPPPPPRRYYPPPPPPRGYPPPPPPPPGQ